MAFLAIGVGLIVSLAIYLTYMLFKPKHAYKASMLLEKVGPDQTWHQTFDFLPKTVAKGYFSKAHQKIWTEIEEAKANTTPEKVFIEQFVYSIGVFLFFFVLYLVLDSMFYLLLAIGGGIYFFRDPRRQLITKAKKMREEIRKETPNFALTVRLLIKGQKTPVDALKIACVHGVGRGMKPFTDVLKADLDYLHPAEALHKFAWATKVPELIEFSTAMAQYMTVGGGVEGEQILVDMEQTFRELDKKMFEREKEVRPAKIKAMNGIIMLDGLLFMATAMILYLAHTMTHSNVGF